MFAPNEAVVGGPPFIWHHFWHSQSSFGIWLELPATVVPDLTLYVRWLREINVSELPEGEGVCFNFPLESFSWNGLWFFPRESFESIYGVWLIGKDELPTGNLAGIRREGALQDAGTVISRCGKTADLFKGYIAVSWEAKAAIIRYS